MKIKYLIHIAVLSLSIVSCDNITDNHPAGVNNVLVLDSRITEEHYSVLLENRFSNISVPLEIFNNNKLIPGNIEAQGAGSRFFPKWGYTITLNGIDRIYNLNSFNLTTQIYDRSKIRTALSSFIFNELGFHLFKSTHCFFKINNDDKGLFVLVERIENEFFTDRQLPLYELVKVTFGAKFTYTELNDLKDNFEKKIPDDKNFSNLAEFINAIDTADTRNIFNSLGKFIDINQYLKYHAASSIINNSDGLTNNFYLYKDRYASPYTIIPWDFDKTFDPKADLGISGDNGIIRKLFRNDSCLVLYRSHLKNIIDNIFTEDKLFPIIDSVFTEIKPAFNLDPYLGLNGISLDHEIDVLKSFISERRLFIYNHMGDKLN